MAARDPGSEPRRDLWLGLDKLGGSTRVGRTQDALQAYEEALAIAIGKGAPGRDTARRDLSLCLERIGDLRLQLGRNDAALASYQRAMEFGKQAVARRPNSAEASRSVCRL